MKHRIRRSAHTNVFSIILIGAGGTGAEVLRGLAKIALAARELHQIAVRVTVMDGDRVSRANLVRQPFTAGDIGRNKAECLVNRYNLWAGLNFRACPEMFAAGKALPASSSGAIDLVVSCVDNAATRAALHQHFRRSPPRYWLDCGNLARTGQVVLGEPHQQHARDWYGRLPTVTELFPELLDPRRTEPDLPSCSLAEALERQDLLVNEAIGLAAKQLVWQLVCAEELAWHGAFVDLASGRTVSLPVDVAGWKRFGHRGARKPPERKDVSKQPGAHIPNPERRPLH